MTRGSGLPARATSSCLWFHSNPRGLNCFLTGNRHELHTISFYTTDTRNPEGLLGQWSQEQAACPTARSCGRALPRDSADLLSQLANRLGQCSWEVTECAVSGRSRRGQQVLCSLSCDRGCKTLALILEGISWTLGDVPEWQHPNSSYMSLSGGPHVFSRPPVYSTLFLILLDQHDVIAVLHQCDVPQTVQMVQISWDYILAAGERVIKALEQN